MRREGPSFAYDSVRQESVLFGGCCVRDGNDHGDTWSFDGGAWTKHEVTPSPAAREYAAMAFDEARGEIVLFGGLSGSAGLPFSAYRRLGDTWTWDGETWTQELTLVAPPPRTSANLVYDAARREIILFGGCDNSGCHLGDTWIWDGSDWELELPEESPSPRGGGVMAYDAARQEVVLFGGFDTASLGDTWTWNGTTWTLRSPESSPPARQLAGMTYDATHEEVVLSSGFNPQVGNLRDTWTWNGTTWLDRAPPTQPTARFGTGLVYDAARERVVMYGGGGSGWWHDETWTWDGVDWAKEPSVTPGERDSAMMAYHPGANQMVLFGGFCAGPNGIGACGSASGGDTWTFDGIVWTKQSYTAMPPSRRIGTMAYHAGTGKLVLFGGRGAGYLGDTWTWGVEGDDGESWHEERPPSSPSARAGHSMAYDAARDEIVLFSSEAPGGRQETWTWDGETWTKENPPTSPPGRPYASMGYDAVNEQVVLFGGWNPAGCCMGMVGPGTAMGDTWTWDGETWTQRNVPSVIAPRARFWATMASDPTSGKVLLFGGAWTTAEPSGLVGEHLADAWTWDGSGWVEVTSPSAPSGRFSGVMSSAADGVFLFGGLPTNPGKPTNDAWLWQAVAGPEPSPSASQTASPTSMPTATESPSPSPSELQQPETTTVTFSERSAESGQYSDETLFDARLADSDGDPIQGAELTFELTGAESSRTFTATTDPDGVAIVTPTLEEKPGPHQLTVRYAGDDDFEGSSDTTTFVVDKEDSDIVLTVEGNGNKRTLTARLSDRDTPGDGISVRTIDFYADGELIGSATTDDDGIATLKPPPRYRGGKHDFEARFEGDDYYAASSARRKS